MKSRKSIFVYAVLIFVFIMSFLNISTAAGGPLNGDVNLDEKVTAVDAMLLRQHLNSLITLTSQQLQYADADRNGLIEAADADFIDLIIVGADQKVAYINGKIFTSEGEHAPITGATVELIDKSKTAVTDANGEFHIQVPGDGVYDIHITKEGYTEADRSCTVVSHRDYDVDDIYLSAKDSVVANIGESGGSLTNSLGNLQVIVPAKAITKEILAKYSRDKKLDKVATSLPFRATWYQMGTDLPGPLPQTSVFTYASDHEPAVDFATSVTVRVKNVKNFPPNTPVPYAYWNAETQQWEDSVMGAVTSDGLWIEFPVSHFNIIQKTRERHGVAKMKDKFQINPGSQPIDWNLVPNNPLNAPNSPNTYPYQNNPCRNTGGVSGSPFVSLATGNVSVNYSLPEFTINNQIQKIQLSYNSNTSSPTSLLGADINWASSCVAELQLVSYRFQIEGLDIWRKMVVTCSNPNSRHGYMWDCKNARGEIVKTGLYVYKLILANHFGGHYWWTDAFGARPIGDTGVSILIENNVYNTKETTGYAAVNNNIDSEFGAGWSLLGVPKLFTTPYTGKKLILVNFGNVYNQIFENNETDPADTYNSSDGNGDKIIVATSPGTEGILYTLYKSSTGEVWYLNALGQPVRFVDGKNMPVLYQYDLNNKLIRIIYPVNNYITFSYNDSGFLSSVTDIAGRKTFFTIDANNDLTQIQDAEGNQTKYVYTNHLMTTETTPENNSASLEYNKYNRAEKMTEPDGGVHQFNPEEVQNCINDLSPDSGGWYTPDPMIAIPTTKYKDPTGRTWSIYTSFMKPEAQIEIKRSSPSGRQSATLLDNAWRVLEYTDQSGVKTQFSYDSDKNLSEIKNTATGKSYVYTWDKKTSPAIIKYINSIKTPDDKIYTFNYDDNGRLKEMISPAGNKTEYTRDSSGRIINKKLPDGNIYTYEYDNAGNMITIADPVSAAVKYEYDNAEKIAGITDPDNNTNQFIYNKIARITKIIDPLLNEIKYDYNNDGNITKTTDTAGKEWGFEYDSMKRLKSITYPNSEKQTREYDLAGRLTKINLPNAASTSFTYSSDGDLSGYATNDSLSGLYSYDHSTKTIKFSSNDTKSDVIFDTYYNPVTYKTKLTKFPSRIFEQAMTYNNTGKRLTATDMYGTINYSYNDDNALTNIQDINSSNIQIDRDSLNRISKITYPNGIISTYKYSKAGFINSINHTKNSIVYASTDVTYDAAGNPLFIVYTSQDESTSQTTRKVTCTYDERNQISSYTDSSLTNQPRQNIAFTYDQYGRMDSDGVFTYSYDKAGNIIQKLNMTTNEKWIFSYSGLNLMKSADYYRSGDSEPYIHTEYKYDAQFRRIMKKINNAEFYYVYDGYNILYEVDEKGNIQSRYTHIPDVMDFPLIAYKKEKRYYYHLDPLNSVMFISDESGNKVVEYSYTPFGTITKGSGFSNPFTFTSRELDYETGLMYYRSRYYQPVIGRFTQLDITGLNIGLNNYIYAGNNPLKYMDSLGMQGGCNSVNQPGNPNYTPGSNSPNNPNPQNPQNQNPAPPPNYEQQLQNHLDQLNHWGNVGQQVLGGGNYTTTNYVNDVALYAAADQGLHPSAGPAFTAIQAAPTATVGVGIFHNNAAAVNDILNLPELNGGR